VPPAPGSWFGRNEFLIRRLHSLTGLVPVGAYMCVHLLTNATTLGGPEFFQQNVDLIHTLGPALPIVEWTFIFLPLIFHAVVGVVIIRSGNPNLSSYHYVGNVRYFLQRATAWIALFFIAYHVFQMHGWIHHPALDPHIREAGGHVFKPDAATSTAAEALQPMFMKLIYFVGVISTVFHFANGLWTMGITWGVWTTAAAQKRANWICGAIGVGLALVSVGALVGVSTTNIDEAKAYEQAHREAEEAEQKRKEELLKQPKADKQVAEKPATADQ
jgi:succinate dehydrogenase / fumarate reductase, cytochrome b subunit